MISESPITTGRDGRGVGKRWKTGLKGREVKGREVKGRGGEGSEVGYFKEMDRIRKVGLEHRKFPTEAKEEPSLPGSVMERTQTRKNLPQAVPNSMLLPL